MEKKPLYSVYGLKCDYCDFRLEDITYEEYPEWIDRPCPICGHSLLTQKDYDAVKSIVDIVDKIEKIFGKRFTRFILGKGKRTQINFHGNGWADAEIKEIKTE